MKVPPPEKPPTYDKDKTFTRRNIAGAAGGMLGVDYEDTKQPDPSSVKASVGAGPEKKASPAIEVAAAKELAKEVTQKRPRRVIAAPKEEAEMILQDEDPNTKEEKLKQRGLNTRGRDRMSIDKDPPQRRRKPSWDQLAHDEPEEIDLEEIAASIGELARSFEDRRAYIGDPRLLDPHAIKEALGAPVAYAKHCMVLAEAFRATTGATRAEAVAYLALLFAGLGDRAFARQALKELGPSTGIIDIYPLEVIEHVVEAYPGLLLKAGFGTLFVRPKKKFLDLEAGVAALLDYPSGLKVRGFAIKGGGRPGYRFEPTENEGRYLLMIFAPGRYRLLISALTRSGHTVIDRFDAMVRDGTRALPPLFDEDPPRDAAKVEAWPKPVPVPVDYSRMLEDEAPAQREDSNTLLSSGELISRQQRGHLELATEESVEFVDAVEPPHEEDLGIVDPDDVLSRAEASLLKLAVVLSTENADFSAKPPDEEE